MVDRNTTQLFAETRVDGANRAAHDPPLAGRRTYDRPADCAGATRLWPTTRDQPGACVIRPMSQGELDERVRGRSDGEPRPAALPRTEANRALLSAWVQLLAPRFDADGTVNLTGTYRDDYGLSHGLMLPRNVVRDFTRAIDYMRPDESLPWAIGVERHNTGRDVLHFHAMVGGDWTQDECDRLKAYWTYTRGWAVAKPVVEVGGCVAYCAKHLLKRGSADNFEFELAPHLAFPSRHDKRTRDSAR